MTEIYGRADWYAARPEHEERWEGVLERREAPGGPAARSALTFALVVEGRPLDVYAANVEETLAGFVGRPVVASGKLVDLSGEGYGEELWLASIRTAPSDRER